MPGQNKHQNSTLSLWAFLLLLVIAALAAAAQGEQPLITGDLDVWDAIFASRTHRVFLDGPANGLVWTEGPLAVGDELFFTDTVGDTVYAVATNLEEGRGGAAVRSERLRVVKARSGESPPDEYAWRAEPGGNGMAALTYGGETKQPSRKALLCQHGARRIVAMDLGTGGTRNVAASAYGGRRLNGPNDVFVRSEADDVTTKTYAYFTDPIYAWLEKERFEDLPYTDTHVRTEGPGHCGVYRVEIADNGEDFSGVGNVELVTAEMQRPNGIGFVGDDLVVSECCQGSHLDRCTSGTSRWEVWRRRNDKSGWDHVRTMEDIVSSDEAEGGCADGFALHEINLGNGTKNVLLASCFGGLCILDPESGTVAARLWTAKKEHGGCRISNVALGWGHAFLTGSCGVFTLTLKGPGNIDNRAQGPFDAEL